MKPEHILLDDASENLDDADAIFPVDEWANQLTVATRDALLEERAEELEISARQQDHAASEGLPTESQILALLVEVRDLLITQHPVQHRRSMPEQEWFSIDEAAALTGLSADHMRRHVVAGTLPVCNQGTFEKPYYRIRRSDIDAWMSQRMQQPGPTVRKKKTTPGSYRSRHHGNGEG